MPVCPCGNIQREKEQQKAERLKRRGELDRIYRNNIMNDNLVAASLDNFIPREGTEKLLSKSKEFIQTFSKRKTGLLSYGEPGNGKSHLAAAIHHILDEQGYISLFIDCSQLFNIAEEARRFSSKNSIPDLVKAAIYADLLTLDELGVEPLTSNQFADILFPIINGRQGRITNYTTNLDIHELRKWLENVDSKGRLYDRILGSSEIIKNSGTSKRFEDALNRMNGQYDE
jgi:DNA replication protein DnaC